MRARAVMREQQIAASVMCQAGQMAMQICGNDVGHILFVPPQHDGHIGVNLFRFCADGKDLIGPGDRVVQHQCGMVQPRTLAFLVWRIAGGTIKRTTRAWAMNVLPL